jgi:hypothetical protein
VCERRKEKKKEKDEVSLSRFRSFILVFIDGITDKQLNINIFNIFVSDSVCKVKWKFSRKVSKSPPYIINNFSFHG